MIAREVGTTERYVNNIRSELKRKHGIVLAGLQRRRQETDDAEGTNPTGLRTRLEPTPTMPAPETGSPNASSELETDRNEVQQLKSTVSRRTEKLKLDQQKQQLQRQDIVLAGETELCSSVSDICPDIRMMWKEKKAYTEVMIRMYRSPLCRWIFEGKSPFWVYDRSERKLTLVLEQIFDSTSSESKIKHLDSETVLTDSVLEFYGRHLSHPLCPTDYMPGLPTVTGGWECPDHHKWYVSHPG